MNICNTILDYPTDTGAMPLLYSIRDCIPYSMIGLLFVIGLIIFTGQYYLIKSRTGRAKILIALLSSSFVMVILSMLAALGKLVPYLTAVFYGFLTIIAFVLLVLSDNT